jgi:hypothetical protein
VSAGERPSKLIKASVVVVMMSSVVVLMARGGDGAWQC